MERVESARDTQEIAHRWHFGHCEFVEATRQLFVNGEVVRIESKPLDVLQQLLEGAPQIVSKDELIGAAWNVSTSDQSLATAVSKLRKAFGGERDSIILSVSGMGYRMAVPVIGVMDEEPAPPAFHLEPGQPIPGRENWVAERQLGIGIQQNVWIARHKKTREARVFKFASDGLRLRALQREVTLSRVFQEKLPAHGGFLRVLDWSFEEAPFFIESEYSGLNLYEFAETEDFKGMPLEQRIDLAIQLAETIAAAHGLGILHNDLKPSNILVVPSDRSKPLSRPDTTRGEGLGRDAAVVHAGDPEEASRVGPGKQWQVKVVDFGVASFTDPQRLLDMQITHHGAFDGEGEQGSSRSPLGSAIYCAPELRVPGAVPHVLGDIYSLGVLLYQIAKGDFLESPEPGWETRIADPILRQDIAAAANVDPKLRLQSAAELAARLLTLETRRTAQEREEKEAARREFEAQELRRVRQRRPWLMLAAAALILGLCASLWFYRQAVQQRDLANSQTTALAAMNDFLTQDILSQSNPLVGAKRNGQVEQRTLVESIEEAIPKIDQRFSSSPWIAGRLHEEIAAALNGRMEMNESDREFAAAAQHFREAEGPLSQNAIIAQLRRENLEIQTKLPDSIEQARKGYKEQEELIGRLPSVSAELQAWQAMTATGLCVVDNRPDQGISVLKDAVRRAESTPDFNSQMLFDLRLRFAGLYLGLNDGPNAARIAREAILGAEKLHGAGNPEVMEPEMYLQEAMHVEEKYSEAVQLGRQNVQQFTKVLGPSNKLTIAALTMVADDEGMLGHYESGLKVDLSIIDAKSTDPAFKFDIQNTLLNAAGLECNLGQYSDGIALARRVRKESSTPPNVQLGFFSWAAYQEADCLVAQQEDPHVAKRTGVLDEAQRLLETVEIKQVASMEGLSDFEGYLDLTKGRLALLQGRMDVAYQYDQQARSILERTRLDPKSKSQLTRLEAAVAHSRSGGS